jgi:AhpD family alkylhydroperoxidase
VLRTFFFYLIISNQLGCDDLSKLQIITCVSIFFHRNGNKSMEGIMAKGVIEKFQKERQELNRLVMSYAGQGTKRFYSLDSQAYREGALSSKVKELLGLVASFVLRCDDCIKYHIIQCFEAGVSDEELEEALFIGLVVGGTITIPHQRRAMQAWDELKKKDLL